MFIYDKPIETEIDDFLGRKSFSQHLGNALLYWKENESLVIAIYGEWGSGKSSVINLARGTIKNSNIKNKPTIIEFNPWGFSEENNLGEHFFNEIAKELEIRNDTKKDKRIAKKLKFYASLLGLTSEKNLLTGLSSKVLIVLGVFGVSSSQIISWLNIPINWIKNVLLIGGLLLLLVEIFKGSLLKLANYHEKKAEYYSKSVSEAKQEIKKELIERDKKLIIIIDDIDRLNQSEIRQIFRLIRINADFPNTIYLLAFDRKIIEKNLEEQVCISGKDYLNKIVQVNFDLPLVKPSKISSFLFKELDRILKALPESAQKYFGQDNQYRSIVNNSWFKDLFKNIRDVKRFASSLEFNISQMYQGDTMEVNPIDFIAIEAIRVFAPDFYLFMRDKSQLFTSTGSVNKSSSDNNPRKNEIENVLNILPKEIKESVFELLKILFPQIDDSSYGNESQSSWSNKLRVCATNNFDSYFTLIPGGDEEELSQLEIEEILSKANFMEDFEKILREYIEKKKIRKVLQRIQDFTGDQDRISQNNVKNVVTALFNIFEDLPEEEVVMFGFVSDMGLDIIIKKLLKRETDKNKNFEILKEAILLSKGLIGPVYNVRENFGIFEKGKYSDKYKIPEDKIEEIQKLCLKKIEDTKTDNLLNHKNLLYILYRWKDWDKEKKWGDFIKEIAKDNQKLILFMAKFVLENRSYEIYSEKITKWFMYKWFSDFFDLEDVKIKLEEMKRHDSEIYKGNKETIDLYLDKFYLKDKEY